MPKKSAAKKTFELSMGSCGCGCLLIVVAGGVLAALFLLAAGGAA